MADEAFQATRASLRKGVNRENIKKWVEALRSGEYNQGQGYLRLNGQFCCLGVACEISGIGEWDEATDGEGDFFHTANHDEALVMPTEVSEWLGIDSSNPRLILPSSTKTDRLTNCTDANDDLGYDFHKIADLIEDTYLS